MTLFEVIKMVAVNHGCAPDDGWIDDIYETIVEDNGEDLTEDEVIELTEQFFEEEE